MRGFVILGFITWKTMVLAATVDQGHAAILRAVGLLVKKNNFQKIAKLIIHLEAF